MSDLVLAMEGEALENATVYNNDFLDTAPQHLLNVIHMLEERMKCDNISAKGIEKKDELYYKIVIFAAMSMINDFTTPF